MDGLPRGRARPRSGTRRRQSDTGSRGLWVSGPSAPDAPGLSRGLLEAATLSGGVDAPVDSLPLRVVVGCGIVEGDVVSGFAEWRRAVEGLFDVMAGSLSGGGGLVDPVLGEGLGEDAERILVIFRSYVGVIGVSAAGHGRIEAAAVDGTVDEEEGVVDGAALRAVDGVGVAEFEVFSGVVGGEADRAG